MPVLRPPGSPPPWPDPDADQARAIGHRGGALLVRGAAGTGKTVTALRIVADRVDGGLSTDDVLLLAPTRRAAARLRDELSGHLRRTTGSPVVRTASSAAFAVLRARAALLGEPPPTLISGPEQDLVLGDLLMRAAERGLGPADLARLGDRHGRPEWVAAATVYAEYLDVTRLRAGVRDGPSRQRRGGAAALAGAGGSPRRLPAACRTPARRRPVAADGGGRAGRGAGRDAAPGVARGRRAGGSHRQRPAVAVRTGGPAAAARHGLRRPAGTGDR